MSDPHDKPNANSHVEPTTDSGDPNIYKLTLAGVIGILSVYVLVVFLESLTFYWEASEMQSKAVLDRPQAETRVALEEQLPVLRNEAVAERYVPREGTQRVSMEKAIELVVANYGKADEPAEGEPSAMASP